MERVEGGVEMGSCSMVGAEGEGYAGAAGVGAEVTSASCSICGSGSITASGSAGVAGGGANWA